MRARLLLPSLVLFLGVSALAGGGEERGQGAAQKPKGQTDDPAAVDGVGKNMTAAQVHDLHREPHKISRQILFRRHVEQWTYTEPISLRIEFQAIRGQEARVVSVHSLRSRKP